MKGISVGNPVAIILILISSGFRIMNEGGYTIEVTCLSSKAIEKDLYDFF